METLLPEAASLNAEDIDRGIRDTIQGIHRSILGIALALANIKANKLFITLGFKSMTAYIIRLSGDICLDRSGVFNWLYIGEAYTRHKSELERAGFTDSDGLTKLPYLERALGVNKKREVFKNIKTMSVREFVSYAKGVKIEDHSDEYDTRWVVVEKGNSFYLNGKLMIIISSKISRRVSYFMKKVVRLGCYTLEREVTMMPVMLQNKRDARRLSPAVVRLKQEMGLGNV